MGCGDGGNDGGGGEGNDGGGGEGNGAESSPPTKVKITDIHFEKALQGIFIYTKGAELEFTDQVRTTLILDFPKKSISSIEGIQIFKNLDKLNLGDNKLISVESLENLTQLTWLSLDKNRLTDLKGLEKLTKLEVLYLRDNPSLTKAQIDELQKALPNCRIFSNPILTKEDVIQAAIHKEFEKPTGELTKADLEKVKRLNLTGKQLTSIKGLELENLTKLEALDLSNNKLTDVKGLEKLTQLTELDLSNNKLTDVKGLEKLTQLTELDLSDNSDLTKTQIDQLQKALPKCRIYINGGGYFFNSNPKKIGNTSPSALLRLKPLVNKVYVGEVFPISMELLSDSLRLNYLPDPQLCTEGIRFTGRRYKLRIGSGVSLNGHYYSNVLIFDTGAIAMKPGKLNVLFELQVTVWDHRADINGRKSRLLLQTDPIVLEVIPLPKEGQPKSFTGAVGQLQMTTSVKPNRVEVGEPIKLSVTLSGQGTLDNTPIPEADSWEGFKTFAATSEVQYTDIRHLNSRKTFQRMVIPTQPTLSHMPALKFSYFNPRTEKYVTLRSPSSRIEVTE